MIKKNKNNWLIIIFIISCSALFSCKTHRFELADLTGDWILDFDSIKPNDDYVGCSIVNDSIYSVNNYAHISFQGKLTLKCDTLLFFDEIYKSRSKYVIDKLNNDSLIILNNGKRLVYHNKRLEYNPNLHFSKITLILGQDNSSDLNMILDSSGLLKYSIPQKKINKILKLNPEKRLLIDSLFKYSCIDKISNESWNRGYDGWCKTMVFEYNNKVKKIITNEMTMPLRINEIFYRMIQEVDGKIY